MGCGCTLNGVKGSSKADVVRRAAVEVLKKLVPEGSTVFYVVKHASASSYNRSIAFYVLETRSGKVEPKSLTSHMAHLWKTTIDANNGGMKIQSDGHQAVAELAHALYGTSRTISSYEL